MSGWIGYLGKFIATSWQYVGTLVSANAGHVLSLVAAVILTTIALYPILAFFRYGWELKKKEIFSCFSENAKILYLKKFLKLPLADGAAAAEFERIYNDRYGLPRFRGPILLFAIVCLAAMYLFSETGITQIMLLSAGTTQTLGEFPPGRFAYLVLSGVPAAGIAGAYLWLVSDLIGKAYRLSLKPGDVLNSALRLAMAAAIAAAMAEIVGKATALPIAFALGAFPLDAVRLMFRRFATKTLNLGVGIDDNAVDQIFSLDGVDHPAADRLMDADVSTIAQLAYQDPVQLCMKSGYLFAYIIDIVSQALAWNYLGAKLDDMRASGLRGAMEIYDLLDSLRKDPSDPDAIRAARFMDDAANTAKLSVPALYNAFEEIADDPYTIFLAGVWRQ